MTGDDLSALVGFGLGVLVGLVIIVSWVNKQ